MNTVNLTTLLVIMFQDYNHSQTRIPKIIYHCVESAVSGRNHYFYADLISTIELRLIQHYEKTKWQRLTSISFSIGKAFFPNNRK